MIEKIIHIKELDTFVLDLYDAVKRPFDKGDFDGDGNVDLADLGTLAGNYGTGVGPLNFDAASLGLVPKLASLCLLAVGGVGARETETHCHRLLFGR